MTERQPEAGEPVCPCKCGHGYEEHWHAVAHFPRTMPSEQCQRCPCMQYEWVGSPSLDALVQAAREVQRDVCRLNCDCDINGGVHSKKCENLRAALSAISGEATNDKTNV